MSEIVEARPADARPVVVPQQAASTPMQMLSTAMDRGATIEQMKQLMELQERWEANEARKAFNAAFAAFQAEVGPIIKRKRVHFTSKNSGTTTDYRHAELADVMEAVMPALSKHGLSYRFILKQQPKLLEVTCELKHALGHSTTATLEAPPDDSGNKNPVQAIASTKTMLERQTLKAVCGVSEKGDDDDGRGGPTTHEPEADQGEVKQLSDEGERAAAGGMKMLTDWWARLNKRQRSMMNNAFKGMRKTAQAADADAARGGAAGAAA